MKLKLLILPLIFVIVLLLFFSGNYVYLDAPDLTVLPSPDGNPTLLIAGEVYYVRHWTLAPGCYKLTRMGLLDYNLATQTDLNRCPVQASSH